MMKMVLTDLDHTLLRQDGSISEDTLSIIERCRSKGVLFAIATGRYWIGAEKYIRQLNPDYEITTEGTLIHSRGVCIHSCEFTEAETNQIIRSILFAAPEAEVTVACGKKVFWNSKHIAASEKLHKAVYCDYSVPLKVRGNKIVAELPDESTATQIARETNCQLQCYRGEKWYAFLPDGSGKVSAIRALTEASGLSLDDIVAFGDDLNDIEMLKMCGTGVAVANAVPDVCQTADDITLSNDQDGVAVWLNYHCLHQSLSCITYQKNASTYLNVFWQDILSQSKERLPFYFSSEAVIRWHCTNEQFTVAEYVRANCEYPGDWNGEIERIEKSGNTIILVGHVFPTDKKSSSHVVSLIRFRDGRITEMDEYWADDGEVPAWRREMKIGKPVCSRG